MITITWWEFSLWSLFMILVGITGITILELIPRRAASKASIKRRLAWVAAILIIFLIIFAILGWLY